VRFATSQPLDKSPLILLKPHHTQSLWQAPQKFKLAQLQSAYGKN
jgi:hypothetical protein